MYESHEEMYTLLKSTTAVVHGSGGAIGGAIARAVASVFLAA